MMVYIKELQSTTIGSTMKCQHIQHSLCLFLFILLPSTSHSSNEPSLFLSHNGRTSPCINE